jgi:pilus assembly protein CpaC
MIPAMRRGTLGFLVVVVLAAAFAMGPAEAQVRPADAQGASARVMQFEVTIGKSQVVDLKEPFTRVSVTNPAIADIFVVTPNQILINGKAAGVTSLVVFYPNKTMYFDLVVQTDIGLLKERLKEVAPRDEIGVQAAKDTIILNGSVSSEEMIGKVGTVAEIFAPKKVVNLLKVTDVRTQQVLLQVHVAEVNRTALNELGVSWRAIGRSFMGAAWPGSVFLPGVQPIGTLGDPVQISSLTNTGQPLPAGGAFSSPPSGPNFAFTDLATFFFANGTRDYAGIVRALAQKALLRTLAKPNLITVSGKEAKFLSGGEFPFPVPSGSLGQQTITIDFKPFGVQLVFTPVVREDQTISLRVAPEVSSLDFSQALQISGFLVPALKSNRASTTLELKDGESFAMAGLINTTVRQQVAKVPLLGDIPILGVLFRSTHFQNDESELVFIVTVRLVKPFAPGEGPDPTTLFELRDSERDPYTGINTMVPGIPGVGEIVERPIGESALPSGKPVK